MKDRIDRPDRTEPSIVEYEPIDTKCFESCLGVGQAPTGCNLSNTSRTDTPNRQLNRLSLTNKGIIK